MSKDSEVVISHSVRFQVLAVIIGVYIYRGKLTFIQIYYIFESFDVRVVVSNLSVLPNALNIKRTVFRKQNSIYLECFCFLLNFCSKCY